MFLTLKSIIRKLRVWGVKGIIGYIPRRIEAIGFRRELVANFRKNRKVRPMRGITVIAPLSMGNSNSKVARDLVCSLMESGIPCQTFDVSARQDLTDAECRALITPHDKFKITRFTHVIEMFRSPLPAGIVKNRARIAFWEGERGLLDAFPYLASSDPVIAMSDYNFVNFRSELPATTPVFKILYPLRPPSGELDDRGAVRARYAIPPDDFVVLFNFDLGSFYRKNPLAVMKAFALALGGKSDARLIFKTNLSKTHPEHVARLLQTASELRISSQFMLINEYLSTRDLYSLTNACDLFLSLHRAEGFGIGVAEAMSMGKPVIATDYSATREFCNARTALTVPFTLVKPAPGEYFESIGVWADADISYAAHALEKCYNNCTFCLQLGQRGKIFIEERFSLLNFKKSVEAFLDA